jgi:hypothetical protein
MLIPDWDKILFSKSASPVQELFPSLSIVLGLLLYLHRLIILRRWQRELVLVFVKYPMLLVEPNCVPDLKFTLVALTHGELINIFINKFLGGV